MPTIETRLATLEAGDGAGAQVVAFHDDAGDGSGYTTGEGERFASLPDLRRELRARHGEAYTLIVVEYGAAGAA